MSENLVEPNELIARTSDIVVAHISRNSVPTAELPELIETVFNTLSGLGTPEAEIEAEQKPAFSNDLLRIKGDLYSSQSGDGKLLRLLRGFREQLEHHKGTGVSDR
jgi:predicted transcriptional regulator